MFCQSSVERSSQLQVRVIFGLIIYSVTNHVFSCFLDIKLLSLYRRMGRSLGAEWVCILKLVLIIDFVRVARAGLSVLEGKSCAIGP